MTREHQLLCFPTFVSALGGVQSVRYSARFAWITRADGRVMRKRLSQLPPVHTWTAFSLADAVQS